ncbi:hypothetical protein DSM106972_093590 [Dulcicalothrix desertica PCC 7102]|uniref:Uncharacterized protein n=1 Tax=Dulcicalothrix desertica PCC 7102 TaxID=232991 RepID=A0A3S1AKV5_9CYAN|nr:hypothetical protein [Dulcicalothrix desertica]RUS94374.1 hypothetical protein DSM106972_093590 [Dulcicalothrix desertica PCC 7102]TWH55000.1 hypothetical protein CAL7102_03095 [Dulcicalothrix desertica PCC 7102]
MDIALTAQLYQVFLPQPAKLNLATAADDIHSLLELASGALMAAGEVLKQTKQHLSRARFSDWLDKNDFVTGDANKLIKLFESFGNIYDDLTTVSPLSLMGLLAPKYGTARDALVDMVEEFRKINDTVTTQDVETLRKAHSPQPKKAQAVVKMVGNQPGGTGIFRLEVKSPELANQIDTEWKQSGCSPDKWMEFVLASTHKIQDIAQVVLGRKIVEVSELSELDVVIDRSQNINNLVGVELEIDDFGQVLPSQVVECLNKLRDLDVSLDNYSNPIARRLHREERATVLAQLKILAEEYQLDIESLVWRQHLELARC